MEELHHLCSSNSLLCSQRRNYSCSNSIKPSSYKKDWMHSNMLGALLYIVYCIPQWK